MISRFAPVWNVLLEGLGNHAPGSGRYNGRVPRWAVLHPRRGWATKWRVTTNALAALTGRQIVFCVKVDIERYKPHRSDMFGG